MLSPILDKFLDLYIRLLLRFFLIDKTYIFNVCVCVCV